MWRTDTRRVAGGGRGRLRRVTVALAASAVLVGALAPPVAASGHGGRLAPLVWMLASTNDDGRLGLWDVTDDGNPSTGYDRWGRSSSDDPTDLGMAPSRMDYDIARCSTWQQSSDRIRVLIENAYPGYGCTFVLVSLARSGEQLEVDEVTVETTPGIVVTPLGVPTYGIAKLWSGYRAAYGVTIGDGVGDGQSLEFEIQITYRQIHPVYSSKRCHSCPR